MGREIRGTTSVRAEGERARGREGERENGREEERKRGSGSEKGENGANTLFFGEKEMEHPPEKKGKGERGKD